jgi:hypothetical protein
MEKWKLRMVQLTARRVRAKAVSPYSAPAYYALIAKAQAQKQKSITTFLTNVPLVRELAGRIDGETNRSLLHNNTAGK